MATTTSQLTGNAAMDLGLGGNNLTDQVGAETAAERKKRLLLQQQRAALGPAASTLGLGGFNG